MITQTGHIVNLYEAPVPFNDADAPDGVRVETQINLTLKSIADDREYNHSLPVSGDKDVVALKSLEEWQAQGKLVTVFCSGVRAIPFLHDSSKDEQGNPLKRYQRAGRKMKVGDIAVEGDAFVVFAAYQVELADKAGLDKYAEQAHGAFLRRQAEIRRRSNQARIQRAQQMVEERKTQVREAKAKEAQTAQASGAPKAQRSA